MTLAVPLVDRPHHVYVIRDECGDVTYVGCTSNVRARMKDHRSTGNYRPGYTFTVESTHPNQAAGWKRERELIFAHEPRRNRQGNPARRREGLAAYVLRHELRGMTVALWSNNDGKLWTILSVLGDDWIDNPDVHASLDEYVRLCAKTGCPVPGIAVKPDPWDLFVAEFERRHALRTAA